MKETAPTISALLITYNEIDHIEAVIETISFADEIIVVDSHSTDGTFEKLSEIPQVKVFLRKFKNFPEQRNFAISQATCDWILFVDADERLTPNLQKEILDTLKSKPTADAFKIRRQFVFNDKIMRFSGLQTDKVLRLFRNGVAQYDKDRLVHELLDYKGEYKLLKHPMMHYSFSDYESYKKKTEHYGYLKAHELLLKGKRPNWFHFVIKPAYKFITNYVFRLGFLDGKEGYTICSLNAYGVFYRYKALQKLLASTPK
ncbi:glycosyltransferase family 2 protein [Psychroserpens sp. XS_ASV72]|uniref:glycosyltransferase family 2 protein n=1 Tax=Psychroserpens sp. XS_ASV72 TaxID=3241293 RepID=UPI00351476F0